MYSGFQVCVQLGPKEKCFRLRKYKEGTYVDIFHEHIPRHRISADNTHEFMKILLACNMRLDNSTLLHAYLNDRGKKPRSFELCQIVVEYPEPGVFRKYYSNRDYSAWFDEVIDENKFRKDGKNV
jgi:hypothetical protein